MFIMLHYFDNFTLKVTNDKSLHLMNESEI